MKKNMMTLVILALLVVNTALTGIMMFSVMTTNMQVVELVKKISLAVDVDMGTASGLQATPSGGGANVDIADIATYNIADQLTIKLKHDPESGDEKDRYAVVGITLSLNTKDADYEAYSATLADQEGLIKDEINKVINSYTYEDIQETSTEQIQQKILQSLQNMYGGSQFICGVSFSSWLTQ